MKQRIMALFLGCLTCFLFACSKESGTISAFDAIGSGANGDGKRLISSGPFHRVYAEDDLSLSYCILSAAGEEVFSGKESRPLSIQMVGESLLDIEIGYGTGVAVHTYYDPKQDAFSREYSDVLAASEKLVAYMEEISENNPMESRQVVVCDIFDPAACKREIPLDFSKVDTPVTDAFFSKSGDALDLTYLSGEEQTPTSMVISFNE